MADLKISQLLSATTPLAGTEVLPIVQSNTTKQVSIANLTAGRSVSVADATLTTGNLVIGTSGKGIDFSATAQPAGMTSELLNDYEEGTWTPSVGGNATYYVQEGYYIKVGKLVYVWGKLVVNVLGSGSTTTVSGLPYTSTSSIYSLAHTINVNYYNSLAVNALALYGLVGTNTTSFAFTTSTAAGVTTTTVAPAIFGNSARIDFSGFYQAAS